MKLEEVKNYQKVFKSNLKEIVRGRYRSKEQGSELQNTKRLYEEQESAVKLFNDYYTIEPEAKYKTIHGKGRPSDLAT